MENCTHKFTIMLGEYKKCGFCNEFLDSNDNKIIVEETTKSKQTTDLTNDLLNMMKFQEYKKCNI